MMDSNTNLDMKYQNLASEYSKLRANATVLKKAVLDEQTRNRELKECVKEYEQRLRKSSQEMESLIFRNQQLTKRISVLQEELQIKQNSVTGKRSKSKGNAESNTITTNTVTLLDEELQKKIIDNAQLISAMMDKDLEISNLREIVMELEDKLMHLQKQKNEDEHKHDAELDKLRKEHICQLIQPTELIRSHNSIGDCSRAENGHEQLVECEQEVQQLRTELERCRTDYELLVSQQQQKLPDSDQKTKEYFRQRIDKLMEERQVSEAAANTLAAEYDAVQVRLELDLYDRQQMQMKLEEGKQAMIHLQEEFNTTIRNYEQQLSTMSEHLADLNDKYTDKCEVVQQLTFQLRKNAK